MAMNLVVFWCILKGTSDENSIKTELVNNNINCKQLTYIKCVHMPSQSGLYFAPILSALSLISARSGFFRSEQQNE